MVEVTGKLALPLVVLGFYPMVKIKVTWTEDGTLNEKIIPDEAIE